MRIFEVKCDVCGALQPKNEMGSGWLMGGRSSDTLLLEHMNRGSYPHDIAKYKDLCSKACGKVWMEQELEIF